jgi:F-type H+-transporting ATPase subunit delta
MACAAPSGTAPGPDQCCAMDELKTQDRIVGGMAGRYASALFDLARDSGAVEVVAADLDALAALIAQSGDLARLVRSPVLGAEDQLRALSVLLERMGVAGLAANFVKLVTANRRLFALQDMIRAYKALVAREKGEVTAEVTVAETLADKHRAALTQALRSITGKDVELRVQVNPAIVGGLIVKLGSRMVDASLRTKLQSLRHAMKEAR